MSTLTIKARDFAALVAPVKPHAGRDDMFPVLNAIRFEVRNGYLLAMATDRFRLAIHRTETEAVSFTATVRVREVENLLRIFKPQRGQDPELVMSVHETEGKQFLRVEQTGAFGFDFIDASMSFPLEVGEFPNIAKLIGETLAEEPSEGGREFGLNAVFLADWRHTAKQGRALVIRSHSPLRPVVFAAGDDFIGLQMPMRLIEGQAIPEHWTTTLTKPKPAPKKRAKKAASAA
jgi:hypothetical protein